MSREAIRAVDNIARSECTPWCADLVWYIVASLVVNAESWCICFQRESFWKIVEKVPK